VYPSPLSSVLRNGSADETMENACVYPVTVGTGLPCHHKALKRALDHLTPSTAPTNQGPFVAVTSIG
jgi:hypothetical protein